MDPLANYWNFKPDELFKLLNSSPDGLSQREALRRLKEFGPNRLKTKKKRSLFAIFLTQFTAPFILLLLFGALLAFLLHDRIDATIIFSIVFICGILGFFQEKRARDTIQKLLSIVQVTVTVLRDKESKEINLEKIVPGDVVFLRAGDMIPGDAMILEEKDLFIDEATLTGESYGVEKKLETSSPEVPLLKRSNMLFMGTHVISGQAKALVICTGKNTEIGKISEKVAAKPTEAAYEKGLRHFCYLLMELITVFVVAIFFLNLLLQRPFLDSFLFALALSIGFTPQLLPIIITINLAHGAKKMASRKAILKKLPSIENFGSMNVLCADKTGTLTEGVIQLYSATDTAGKESEKVQLYAFVNSSFQTGYVNPIDNAILKKRTFPLDEWKKLDELPYDFHRKRITILASKQDRTLLITKGAYQNVIELCSQVEVSEGNIVPLDSIKESLDHIFNEWSEKGFRVLGLAYRDLPQRSSFSKEDETDLVLFGFLLFFDPPKANLQATIKNLNNLKITLKMVTGDNRLVAKFIANQVGIEHMQMICGDELAQMSDEALAERVDQTHVFAEIEPAQKDRIIVALKKKQHIVGYIGDGINDAPAFHVADVCISVNTAVDFIKDRADIVLLNKSLDVLIDGVKEGRRTFANTLKYVFMATSANFGNMFSMAGASLFLSFLPLLPKQILLNNLLTDIPETTIAIDNVDRELIESPWRWDMRFIIRFMIVFGLISSIFDYLTFGCLLFILKSSPVQFQTAWFIESVITASVIIIVIRTRKPFFKSRPGAPLLWTVIGVTLVTFCLPWSPIAPLFSLTPLPVPYFLFIFSIVLLYMGTVEVAKRFFYRWAELHLFKSGLKK